MPAEIETIETKIRHCEIAQKHMWSKHIFMEANYRHSNDKGIDIMNTISKITGLIALASASVGAALLFSTPANAFANANAATLQQKCFGSSKTLVERCCNSWVQSHGRPIWMWDTNTSCGQAAGCSAAAPKKALFAAPSAAPSAAPASKAMIINRVRINKKLKDVCGIDIPTSVSHSSKEPPQSIAPVPPPTSATGSLTHGKP